MKKFLLFFVLALPSIALQASDNPPLVSVTGQGEVFVVPDKVAITFQMESFDPALGKAKGVNDEAVKRALALVKQYGVEDKDVQTSYFTVRNGEKYYYDENENKQRSKQGFFVTKDISVTLKDISRLEDLYSAVLEAGVNNITSVEFQSSEIKKYQEAARKQAVEDAKSKATQLLQELGMTLGRPYQIQDDATCSNPRPGPLAAARMYAYSGQANNETIAIGQIKVNSSVAVSFYMERD